MAGDHECTVPFFTSVFTISPGTCKEAWGLWSRESSNHLNAEKIPAQRWLEPQAMCDLGTPLTRTSSYARSMNIGVSALCKSLCKFVYHSIASSIVSFLGMLLYVVVCAFTRRCNSTEFHITIRDCGQSWCLTLTRDRLKIGVGLIVHFILKLDSVYFLEKVLWVAHSQFIGGAHSNCAAVLAAFMCDITVECESSFQLLLATITWSFN